MNEFFFQWYPLVFGLLYVSSTIIRAWLVEREVGANPIMLRFAKLDTHGLLVLFLMAVYLLIAVQILLFTARLPAYRYLGPIAVLAKPWAAWLGFGLTIVPWTLIWWAQNHLGPSWRLGIDESHANVLKSEGLYRFVRHPIYTGMILITMGFFFLMPSVLSAVLVVLSIMGLNLQAALEETYLIGTHGDSYRQYMATTGKWLPRFRRRSRP